MKIFLSTTKQSTIYSWIQRVKFIIFAKLNSYECKNLVTGRSKNFQKYLKIVTLAPISREINIWALFLTTRTCFYLPGKKLEWVFAWRDSIKTREIRRIRCLKFRTKLFLHGFLLDFCWDCPALSLCQLWKDKIPLGLIRVESKLYPIPR